MTRTALAALFLAAGTVGAQSPAGPERSTAVVRGALGHELDEYLSRLEALGYSGGLAVVKGGETVLVKGYGQADREGGVPVRPDSVFNLGSITKPFTAAAILRLQELGKTPPGSSRTSAPPTTSGRRARSTCAARSPRSSSSPPVRATSTRTRATACSRRSSSR